MERLAVGQWSIAVEAIKREMRNLGLGGSAAQTEVEKSLGKLWADVSSICPNSIGAGLLILALSRTEMLSR